MYGKRNQDNRLLVKKFDNLTAKEYIDLVWYKCQPGCLTYIQRIVDVMYILHNFANGKIYPYTVLLWFTKEKIIELGHRTNIGFDQIIFIEKEVDKAFPITIFNSDGGEVSACGNGARCIAYLLSKEKNTKVLLL